MKNYVQCLVILLSLFVVETAWPSDSLKTVQAVRTRTPVIDGVFKEREWRLAGIATNFTQVEPQEGQPASEQTEAYFYYDDKNLYVGVKCFDSKPEKIMSELTSRDESGASDFIALAFDTFNDDRNGYFFGTTPYGSKVDGRIYNDGQSDESWDGVWYVETGRSDEGWVAEFRIPFKSLTFKEAQSMTWGMNILRKIERKKEETFWQPVSRDEGLKVSNFGQLSGLENIQPGMNFQILPYITSGLQQERNSDIQTHSPNGLTGLDVRYGITSNLTAVLTVNPDYAQIEADEDQINLSHYPLILKEKRPFFLEGASIFNTAGNSMSDGEYRTALFYSRRINNPVYGLKTTGKIGQWDMGVLHVLNENDRGLQQMAEDGAIAPDVEQRAFYNVARFSRDIFDRSQIGLITTSKEYEGDYNRIVGVDGRLRFPKNYHLSFEGVQSFKENRQSQNHSVNVYLSHYSDFFKFSFWYQEQAPHFYGNEIGFYDYNNFRNSGGWIQIAPRLEKYGFGIRRMGNNINFWGENFQNKNYLDKATLTRGWNYNFWAQTTGYWMFGAGRSQGKTYDRVEEVLYPRKNYWVWLRNNWSSDVYFRLHHSQGYYRSGYYWSYIASSHLRPGSRFNLELQHNRSRVLALTDDNRVEYRDYHIYLSKFYYHFSRNLHLRLIMQYNSMEQELNTSYLLSYNFLPGSFLYLAYREQFDSEPYFNENGMEIRPQFGSSHRMLQLKLSYLLQI